MDLLEFMGSIPDPLTKEERELLLGFEERNTLVGYRMVDDVPVYTDGSDFGPGRGISYSHDHEMPVAKEDHEPVCEVLVRRGWERHDPERGWPEWSKGLLEKVSLWRALEQELVESTSEGVDR